MVSDLCQARVLADTDTGIFSSIGSIFRYWYQYWNNSSFNDYVFKIKLVTNTLPVYKILESYLILVRHLYISVFLMGVSSESAL